MLNSPKINISPLPKGKYGKSTKLSKKWHHQANESNSSVEAARNSVLRVFCRLRSKMNHSTEKSQKTHFLCNEENEK
jgi:hypothetical protein